jgi:hypothetical protein
MLFVLQTKGFPDEGECSFPLPSNVSKHAYVSKVDSGRICTSAQID